MKDIIIDFSTRQIINGKIEAIQGDNTTKKIKILLKENSLPYNLTGKSVMLTMKKNSSNSYVNKGDFLTLKVTNATNGEVELPINKDFTKEKGGYQLQLSILNEADFEENSILFEAIIYTNLKEEVSGTLVESVIFKEIKQTLQTVKDIAKNEQARQEAEILRENNEDARKKAESERTEAEGKREEKFIQSQAEREEAFNKAEELRQTAELAREEAEKLREEKINTFDARVTKNTQDIASNRKDIERSFEVINDSSFLPFTGQEVTVEHSKVGFTKDLKAEGMTYQNLLNYKSIDDFNLPFSGTLSENGIITVKADGSAKYIFTKKYISLFKTNTIYTVILDVISNTINPEGRISIFGGSGCIKNTLIESIQSKLFKVTTVDDFTTKKHFIDMYFTESCKTGEVKFRIYILEGDYTNKYIPSYFEGIKSVGEKENKISILSSGKNLLNYKNLNLTVLGVMPPTKKRNVFKDGYVEVRSNSGSFNPEVAKIFVKKNTTYYFSVKNDNSYGASLGETKTVLSVYDTNIKPIKINHGVTEMSFNSGDNNFVYVGFNINMSSQLPDNEFMKIYDIMINEGSAKTGYEPYKEDKKEILLPFEFGFKGFQNGSKDTLEERSDGIYLVQRVGKIILNGNEVWQKGSSSTEEKSLFYTRLNNFKFNSNLICDKFMYDDSTHYPGSSNNIAIFSDSDVSIRILNSKLETQDANGFKKWLSQNLTTVYYELATPIEYKITSLNSNELETFKDITYVTSENEIKGNLTFKAPCNIPAVISTLRETNTLLKADNEDLKNKNLILEDTTKKQTDKISQLDDTTTLLITDALAK